MQTGLAFKRIVLTAVAGSMSWMAACHTNFVDKEQFKSAINGYYSSRQYCLWQYAQKFPAQADPAKEMASRGYDALVDAGLLTRMPVEKKRFLIGSKPVNDYDLSDKGRANWTADTTQPGAGNFCFGHPEVSSIDNFTPSTSSGTSQYSVSYHYAVKLPDWANSVETKNAFPNVAAVSAGQAATATLTKINNSWQVSEVDPGGDMPVSQ